MKVKTSELIGAALDWAVAKCDSVRVNIGRNHRMTGPCVFDAMKQEWQTDDDWRYSPSTDWAQGGPIIDLAGIMFERAYAGHECLGIRAYRSETGTCGPNGIAPTHLIAAMRCFVASRLGDEVEIPDELMQ